MRRAHIESGIAGLVATALALGAAELLAAFLGGLSPVTALGELVIRYSPEVLTKSVIAIFGTQDKLVLLVSVVALYLACGSLLGVVTRRNARLGAAGFAALWLAGAAVVLTASTGASVTAVIALAAGAVVGWLALRLLLHVASQADERANAPAPWGSAPESQRMDQRAPSRRAFLAFSAAGAGVAATSLVVSRRITGAAAKVEAQRSALVLPMPSRRATPPLAQAVGLSVADLSPLVTPNADFYRIDTALNVPRVDIDSWRLRITGMVDQPVEFSLTDLLSMPATEEYITLSCVSNEVGGDLVGNALWLGVPLADLLARAGVRPAATQIVGRSVDGFTTGFPTEAALDGRASLVAFGMNGEPLPADHGFPARLVIPGLYGYVSATKWLKEIELTTLEAFDAYWIPRGWDKLAPIKTQSRIDVPRAGQTVAPGRRAIAGVAWGGIRSISRVEVRVRTNDAAQSPEGTWMPAQLSEALSSSTWRQWLVEWDAAPGDYQIDVRATDGLGETQTAALQAPDPNGATGYHRIHMRVRA